jgi:hypothetical protein
MAITNRSSRWGKYAFEREFLLRQQKKKTFSPSHVRIEKSVIKPFYFCSVYCCVALPVYICQFFCLSLCVNVCLSVFLSVSLSFCLSLQMYVCLSVYLSLSLSLCISVSISVSHFVSLSLSLSVSHSVSLSVGLYVSLSLILFLRPSICLSIFLFCFSFCLYIRLSLYPSFSIYVRLSVCHSMYYVCLSVGLSFCLSLYMFVSLFNPGIHNLTPKHWLDKFVFGHWRWRRRVLGLLCCISPLRALDTFAGQADETLSHAASLVSRAGLPDFIGAIYQNGEKYTKLPFNIQSGRTIDQMALK